MLDWPRPYCFKVQHLHPTSERCLQGKKPFIDTLEDCDTVFSRHLDVEPVWAALRGTVYNTATESLGPSTREHKDWFDENAEDIQYLLDEKNRFHKVHLSVPRKDAFNTIQIKLHQMQDSWLSIQVEKIQGYADRHDLKNFYNALKEVYGQTPSPLLSRDGSTRNIREVGRSLK